MTEEKDRTLLKRNSIIEAAIEAFRSEGYDVTSMDRIAEIAGASKRTVYNHFGSKEALFQAVVDRLIDEMVALKRIEYDPGRPLEAQLADFALSKAKIAENPRWLALMRVGLGVFIREPTLARETMQQADEGSQAFTRWLEAARDAGQLEIDDLAIATKIFWALAGGALFWPQVFEGPLDPEQRDELVGEVVATFLSRYRGPVTI